MNSDDRTPQYKALAMLEGKFAPTYHGRAPLWRLKAKAPNFNLKPEDVHTPAWKWQRPATGNLYDLDGNAAWLTAASSVSVAHGALERSGALDPTEPRAARPGLFLVDVHHWNEEQLPHPLGTNVNRHVGARVWIAHPVLRLLMELERDGYLPPVEIHDSWTAVDGPDGKAISVRFRSWTTYIDLDRRAALDAIAAAPVGSEERLLAHEPYEEIKLGYAQAIQMMGGHKLCKIARPDWQWAILGNWSAQLWRKMYKCMLAGCPPVGMGASGPVDEVSFTEDALHRAVTAEKITIDRTGKALGSFKVKDVRPGVIEDQDQEREYA